jgi:quercetin dioxygenase-like cupin family protein
MKTIRTLRMNALAAVVALAGVACPVAAQVAGMPKTPGYSSKPLLTAPISGDESREMIAVSVQIEPGGYSPEHIHPGDCIGTVMEGTVDVLEEGKAVRRVGPGNAVLHARDSVLQYRNSSDATVRILNLLVVEKGKPRALPPPAMAK